MPKKQKFPHLIGSKWTAQATVMGWRHFQVVNRKNEGGLVFAEIVATCDDTVRLWINAKVLKNGDLWQAGWQPLQGQAPCQPAVSAEQVLTRPPSPHPQAAHP
ncbi:MAG: TIGR02450 family Trp-rich protein [Leptolyngbya sp. RL_3_1]|nr:TIGR02450 family Trp-rich protein [Leptolyngbya sp. RL_3_1]